MQINQTTNTPNFQSLKINQYADLTKFDIARLAQIGKEFSNFKHVDLLINEKGVPVIKFKDFDAAYSRITALCVDNNKVTFDANWNGAKERTTRVSDTYDFQNKRVAKRVFDTIFSPELTGLEKVVQMVRFFESRGEWKEQQRASGLITEKQPEPIPDINAYIIHK